MKPGKNQSSWFLIEKLFLKITIELNKTIETLRRINRMKDEEIEDFKAAAMKEKIKMMKSMVILLQAYMSLYSWERFEVAGWRIENCH